MFRCFGLGSDQAKYPIADLCRARPDFLTVDHPLVAIELSFGREARKVTARAGLGITLAPDEFAMKGFANKVWCLRLGAQFQEHGRQHADALTAESGVHLGRAEFFGNDPGADDVGFGAIAAVSLRDGARVVAIGDQFGLPGSHGRTARAIAGLGLLVNIGGDKGFDLCAKGVVLGTIREIHF